MIIKPRVDTLKNFQAKNTVLRKDELAVATNDSGSGQKYYIGDGTTPFNELKATPPSQVLANGFTVYDHTNPKRFITFNINANIDKVAESNSNVAQALESIMRNNNIPF